MRLYLHPHLTIAEALALLRAHGLSLHSDRRGGYVARRIPLEVR